MSLRLDWKEAPWGILVVLDSTVWAAPTGTVMPTAGTAWMTDLGGGGWAGGGSVTVEHVSGDTLVGSLDLQLTHRSFLGTVQRRRVHSRFHALGAAD